jgi:hypothetical protein
VKIPWPLQLNQGIFSNPFRKLSSETSHGWCIYHSQVRFGSYPQFPLFKCIQIVFGDVKTEPGSTNDAQKNKDLMKG